MAAGRCGPCGPCLLVMAIVAAAAWISDAATASSSPEQAGSSQKSVNCMPCSRTYVADAYLDALTSQLAQHRDLTQLPDSVELCKGLADDLDVPTLSELHRQLVGEGSHRRLVYSVKFGNCQDAIVNFLDGYDANLVIIEKLLSGVFADPFELQHFVERKVFLDVAVFGDTNLELPSALSNRSAVEIHFDLKPSTSMNCNLVVELPLHARYPRLVDTPGGNQRKMKLNLWCLLMPVVMQQLSSAAQICSSVTGKRKPILIPVSGCSKILMPRLPRKAAWRIPCGDETHTGFVSSITFLAALVCSMSTVLAASLIP